MKTRFYTTCMILSLLLAALSFESCNGYIAEADKDMLNSVVFENRTGHALHVDVRYPSGNSDKEFCSLDIPSGSYASKEMLFYIFSPVLFTSCVITFDDGRVLTYKKGSTVEGPPSPLNPSKYVINRLETMCVWTFTITEDHYRIAE